MKATIESTDAIVEMQDLHGRPFAARVWQQGSGRARLDPRDQARRLPPDRPARGQARAAVHPQRPRLDRRYPLIVEAALRNRTSRSSSMARRCCSASTASPISTACTRAGMTTRCSSTPSTCWRSMARICASCRCTCARPTWRGCWRGGRRHLRQRLRAGRDRAGPVPQSLRVRARGPGLEAPRQRLPRRPIAGWIKVKNRTIRRCTGSRTRLPRGKRLLPPEKNA
jgi:hypothetical protein